jgi:ubiquinone/menaquinone biosynthesis C-methylase UbiE
MDPAELFRSASWYYERYRPIYPPELFDHLVHRHQLSIGQPVVDLGCGTGRIAIPLAKRGLNVLAIDPSIEMMEEGQRTMAGEETSGDVRWIQGKGEILSELIGEEVAAVTIGQAFHWMDQSVVLQQCAKLMQEHGGVSVISGGMHMWNVSESQWCVVVKETIQEFLGEQRRAGSGVYQQPDEPFESSLCHSAFKNVEPWSIKVSNDRTLDEVVGLLYSTSWGSPHLLGDRKDEFDRTLRQRLTAIAPDGRFTEHYELTCLCAFR